MSEIIEANFTEVSTAKRDLDTITAEIVTITQQTQTLILHAAIEVGRRLCEAKEQVPHGEWGTYLKERVDFSPSTANNFMRIFREYGDGQISFFGDAKSQTFGNLSYSKAVALFAVPAEEREEFAAEVNAEEISVSELKRRIAERESELSAAREKVARKNDEIEFLQNALSAAQKESQESSVSEEERESIRLEAYEEAQRDVRAEAAGELLEARKTAEAEKQKLIQKAEKLDGQLKKAKADAEAKVQKAIAEERAKISALEKQIAEAANADNAAAEELAREKERAAELERRLRLADGDSARFAVYFDELQSCFNKLSGLLARIGQNDAEKAEKLKTAVKTVLGSMGDRV